MMLTTTWRWTFLHLLLMASAFLETFGTSRESAKNLNKCEQCFGFGGGTRIETPELHEHISPEKFFKEYVHPAQRPVIMRGIMKDTDAFRNWQTDDYLMSLDVPQDSKQRIEINKIQDSSKPIINMNFLDFVEIYHDLPYYMVDTLPVFLRQDVTLPWCLQCEAVKKDILADLVIWFSSGGTNGYVHTDQVDNLHCVFSGNKYFIMSHPKYLDKIKFDKPVSTSSHIDVNHVGYDTRPELLEVEYYHANISEGDCVFIPFEWIHQVRSYGERHIAISIWWDNYNNSRVDSNKCNTELDPNMKLSDVALHPNDHNLHVGTIKDGIIRCVNKVIEEGQEGMTFVRYARFTFSEMGSDLEYMAELLQKSLPHLKKLYALIDTNGDGLVVPDEVKKTDDEWMKVRNQWVEFMRFVDVNMKDFLVQQDNWWDSEEIAHAKNLPGDYSLKEEL